MIRTTTGRVGAGGGRGTGGRSLRLLALTAILAVSFLALAASSAFAAHVQLGTIGEPCPAGEVPCGPGKLKEPAGVAVNEATHDVYVVDKGNDRVEIFSAAGAYLGFFDGSGSYEFQGTSHTGPAAGSLGREEGGAPTEIETGRFEAPEGIAVDNSCTLHQPPLTETTTPTCDEFDPSYGDVYVVDGPREETRASHTVLDKFTSTGEYIGQIIRANNGGGEEFSRQAFSEVFGLAIDAQGGVWVEEATFALVAANINGTANYANGVANVQIGARNTESGGSANQKPGFAVDSEHDYYVHQLAASSGERLAKFKEDGEALNLEFGLPPISGVAVELTTDHVYVDNETVLRAYTAGEQELEALEVPGGHGSGVGVDASTANGSTLYVADPSTDLVYVYPPEPPGPPTIEVTTVSGVSATSATLEGEVNPHSEPREAPTSYSLEYGPCAGGILGCAGSSFPGVVTGRIPASFEATPVSATVEGLAPGTVYHLRISAENSRSPEPVPGVREPTLGPERTFATQGAASGLPDRRGYELVSQPDKQGSLLYPISASGLIQASASGDAITYLANGPTESGVEGNSQSVQILSRRAGGASAPWLSADIATPHPATVGVSIGVGKGEYRFFSQDLSSSIVEPFGPFTRAMSSAASEKTPYLRTDFPAGDSSHPCTSSCYRPLVSGCPAAGPCPPAVAALANVPPGTRFAFPSPAEASVGACSEGCYPAFLGSTVDFQHIVLGSIAPLESGAPENGVYEWSPSGLGLVSRLPSSEGGIPVSASAFPELGTRLSAGAANARNAISADGSGVVFSETEGAHHLYLRETTAHGGEGETVRLDQPITGASGAGGVKPIFQTASADGSRILFTDTQQLVGGASESGADLYECEVIEGGGGPECALHDLTGQGAGEAADVLGLVPGASTDGSTVYFVANGVLGGAGAEGALPGSCLGSESPQHQPASSHCNLYVRRDARTRLVAVLSGQDFPDWALFGHGLGSLTDRVSSDGRLLAFMSQRPLTGYDNRDAASGARDEEVYLYDADADGGAGRLVCASCNPSGARPHGVEYRPINSENGGLAGGAQIWPETTWLAANIPGWTPVGQTVSALYQSRYLSDQGRLFFNSADALVPGDTNGTEDVYQYEPPSSAAEPPPGDTCTTSSSTYVQASGGCVDLISSGTSKEESAFVDASESGSDVFFLTSSRLSTRDADSQADLYDARVGGGEEVAVRPVECSGDACQQPAVGPSDQTPGSLTFSGAGNVVECPKGKVAKGGRCMKKQQKAKKHKKHHKKKGKGKKKAAQADKKRGGGR